MNSIRFRKSLTFKQARAVVAIAFSLGILVSMVQITADYVVAAKQMGQTVISAMKSVKKPAQSAMFNLDKNIGKDVLLGLFEYPSVLEATLFEETEEFVSLKRKPVDFPFRKYTRLIFGETINMSISLGTSSSQNEQNILSEEIYSGQLVLVVDTYYEGVSFINRAIFILVSGIVRNMLLALLLLLFFYFFITKPVLEIEHALHNIDPKSPSMARLKPPKGHQYDEFSTLISGTNQLLEAIEDNIGKRIQNAEEASLLKAEVSEAQNRESKQLFYQDQLEKKVLERTSDLLTANQKLQKEIKGHKQAEKEKKKLESRLQQAQKMETIGTLAGGVAHDFNNILSPIVGFSEMLREDLPQNSPEQESINEVLQAALRAKDLVRQILSFSSPADQEFKPIKLQPILNEALKLLGSSIPKTIDIQTDIDPGCDVVVADPTQVHQIIMNLATNAYHAMQDRGGILKISLTQTEIESKRGVFFDLIPGKYALLKVIDTGTGIKKDVIDKIFDPYFSTKEKDKGTGLGLSVVQGIVKGCKGDIHIYSEPDKGTEINVWLPIIRKASNNETSDPVQPIQGGTERILLVDDEKAIAKMVQQMLERLGYQVTSKTESIEALEIFKANPDNFDLIITDMTMPKMTGLQLANEIKAVKAGISVIICTGFSEQINEKSSTELGIQGYVTKPVIIKEIAQTIRDVLDDSDPTKS